MKEINNIMYKISIYSTVILLSGISLFSLNAIVFDIRIPAEAFYVSWIHGLVPLIYLLSPPNPDAVLRFNKIALILIFVVVGILFTNDPFRSLVVSVLSFYMVLYMVLVDYAIESWYYRLLEESS